MYHLFYALEDEGILDPVDEVDLFALHYVFLPRINQQLESFKAAYCRHRLRTEHNRTPLQLWTRGVLATQDCTALAGIHGLDELTELCTQHLPIFVKSHNSSITQVVMLIIIITIHHSHPPTQEESMEYGIDWSGPALACDAVERVVVPEVPNYLEESQLSFLKSLVNPLKECADHGKGFYLAVRQLVREMMDP
jgi:hypothetical protein